MPDYPSIPGFRIVGDRPKPSRELSYSYLQLKPEAAHYLEKLRRGALGKTRGPDGEEVQGKKANCIDRESEFSGETLMTDLEAQLACSGCPVLDLCNQTAMAQHPAWGTWGGIVYGRSIEAIERAEENGIA